MSNRNRPKLLTRWAWTALAVAAPAFAQNADPTVKRRTPPPPPQPPAANQGTLNRSPRPNPPAAQQPAGQPPAAQPPATQPPAVTPPANGQTGDPTARPTIS